MSYPKVWSPKWLRECLCSQQFHAPDSRTRDVIQHLIDVLDEHRPLASNGKHGDLHTPTCGCDEEARR
ncbi:hypothetical protein [Nocardia abscessus]|uniref:hypothetical protein n=1 Tax=Nocardia abscessus TaxID=120957 RepID=UPI00030D51FD|nr:hypothetical protein [Nocardia abscessus]MCC3333558.1 hypothetical protein [Nocardia abscessus]